MTKKLCIHIGHYKTGTTALQVFLARNPGFLAQHGVEYSSLFLHHAKHSCLAFSLCRAAGVTKLMHGYRDPTPAPDLWEQLFAHVRASAQETVVVSSEELIRIGEFPEACAQLQQIAARCPDIEVTVVAYLRSPASHLRSWYNQLVKMGIPVSDFTTAVRGDIERIHLDYDLALAPWIAAFGAENLVLRDYDAARRGGDTGIYQDFLGVLGLPFPAGLNLPEGDPNPRIDDRAVELVRMAQNLGLARTTIEAIREQAAQFLAQQDAQAARGLPDFDAVCARIDSGLERIAGVGASNVDIAAFRARLPQAEDQALVDQTQMTGFVLAELLALRKRINRTLPALTERLALLEARLDMVAPPETEAETGAEG